MIRLNSSSAKILRNFVSITIPMQSKILVDQKYSRYLYNNVSTHNKTRHEWNISRFRLPTIFQIISKVCANYTVCDFLLDTLLFRCKLQFQIAIFIYTNLTRQIIILSRYVVTFRSNMLRFTRKTLLKLIISFIGKFLNSHRHRITRAR